MYVLLQPYLVGHLVSELVALYANTAAATTFRNCVLHARALGLLLSLSLCLSRKNFDISKLIGRISRSDYCHSFRPLLLTCSLAVAVPILEWGLIYVYRFQLKFMSPSDLIPKISPHKTATDATRLSLRRRPGGWWSRNINRVYYVWRAGSSSSRALCGQRRYRVCMANRFKW